MGTKPDLSRVVERNDPQAWAEDDLLTMAEAAMLFWPRGPLRAASLRNAAKNGQLAIVIIAGKMMTTKKALKNMANCTAAKRHEVAPGPLSARNMVQHLVEATEKRHLSNGDS
jgi:hypothetical protein